MPKTILIPENFDGHLRVVYEEKCGGHYQKKDGVSTLAFPENGILVLNEDFDGDINYKYYLVDKSGNKTEIQEVFDFKNRIGKIPCVLVGGSGIMGQRIDINMGNQEQNEITYSDFYVYNKDTMDRDNFKRLQKFDSLTNIIVNQCRQSQ